MHVIKTGMILLNILFLSRQKKIVSHALKKQADPLTKQGIVGAFCRAYTIQDAISTLLSDVYEPSSLDGRYDYIPPIP